MNNEELDRISDQVLGMDRPISRRDFLNGVAIGIGSVLARTATAGVDRWPSPTPFAQDIPHYYPPALTGMRGSHDGAFEVAHALRDSAVWNRANAPIETHEEYDLVVVGSGISGLAAAYFYRVRAGRAARVLILDNHDDFGGHAKRNEFRPGGQLWIANGGTYAIDSPFPYSKEARGLMTELGIDPVALATAAAKQAKRRAFVRLQSGYFFDQETFGVDRLVGGVPDSRGQGRSGESRWVEFLAKTPFSPAAQRDIFRLENEDVDYMAGLSAVDKKERLARMSYRDFLLTVVKVCPEVLWFYQTRTHDLYGVGIDAVGALECWAYQYPGFAGMQLEPGATGRLSFTARGYATGHEPYAFHHPDGGASVARHLVRALIPQAIPGSTAEDIVTARVNYRRLDRADWPVHIRLGSTAVRVKPLDQPGRSKTVDVIYSREQQLYRVRAKGVVLACWHMMIPFLVPELPEPQKEALRYGVKVPLVYTTVAVRNWRAFAKLGLARIWAPGMYHTTVRLEQPTRIGAYRPRVAPDQPILLRMTRTPCQPGAPARVQHRAGHGELFSTPFTTFERRIREQLARMLGPEGFDAAQDIEAITVNRWPHGYAYEYTALWDPDWGPGEAPCEVGRQRFGNITIANSDAAAAAYMDQAIDQAYRAVQELFATAERWGEVQGVDTG